MHKQFTAEIEYKKSPINSVSNLVANSVEKQAKDKETSTCLTRCPHICLLGNIYLEDLMSGDVRSLLRLKAAEQLEKIKSAKQQKHSGTSTESTTDSTLCHEQDELESDSNNPIEDSTGIKTTLNKTLHCDECEQSKNLWLCLRENCMFIGCGGNSKDETSFRHSTVHAQNTFHPLAINLMTKAVWCEFCNNRIILDKNNPPFSLRKKTENKSQYFYNPLAASNKEKFDDLELISYLDQEGDRSSRLGKMFGLHKKEKFMHSNYESQESEDNETESDSDKLNKYFMYDNEKESKSSRVNHRNGLIGLSNLGNTCYMNAALQCLSNCQSFTNYFFECAEYIHMRILHKSNYFDAYSTTNSATGGANILPCLSTSYLKLMRELWEDKKQSKNGKNQRAITYYTPNEFVQVVKYLNPMFRGFMQHDSQEFLIYLMDQLHEELKRPVYTEDTCVGLLESEDNDTDAEDDEGMESYSYKSSSNLNKSLSEEVDSGIHRLSIKSSTQSSLASSNMHTNGHITQDGDDESADSFETCVMDTENINRKPKLKNNSQSSDLSDSNFSDANCDNTVKLSNKQKKSTKKNATPHKPAYSSIISEVFEGKLIGQVQCLECRHLSTTTESFQNLSLPIPTREYLQTLQTKSLTAQQYEGTISSGTNNSSGQSWISWMADLVKGYIWTQTIKLEECLSAFFSADDLRGDNMYSCEKCKKLTNGVKYSKLLELPDTLIIHLKRFRHDSMFSTGKINSYVSFPLDELNMQPYLHINNANCHKKQETQYELCSITSHYGGANGGHYIAYCRNHRDDEWYEYDDSYCRKVDFMTVSNVQAYVLFYRKKSQRTDYVLNLREQIISKTSLTLENSLLQSNYISKQWLFKLKYFAEPGPIDNTDFLCKHNFVQPCFWSNIENLVVICSTDTWLYLLKTFGMKRVKWNVIADSEESDNEETEYDSSFGVCNYLYPCRQCQIDDELMKQRQTFEKNEFLRLTEKTRLNQLFEQTTNNPYKNYTAAQVAASSGLPKMFAISSVWFKQWEQFVQFKHCPQKHQIPGPIQNFSICNQQLLKNKVYQLNKNSNYYKLTQEVWSFLEEIYGGGPELIVNGVSQTRQSLRTISTSSNSSMRN